mmetsp:Transcript_26135/g.49650  ORF Transcript_26135/g.49650 Transcript_26135/m.49650 type:complete len:212 (-) Transcript_26135:245-880(-)
MMNKRYRDHMALVLHRRSCVPLEGDAHEFARLAVHHGPAAVAAVDGGVDGDGQRARVGVSVRLHLHPAHHTFRDRHLVAAHGEPENVHLVSQAGQNAGRGQLHGHGVLEAVGLVHDEHGQVALVQHFVDARHVSVRGLAQLHLDEGAVGTHVRRREDDVALRQLPAVWHGLALAANQNTGAHSAVGGASLPWVDPVGRLLCDQYLHHSLIA